MLKQSPLLKASFFSLGLILAFINALSQAPFDNATRALYIFDLAKYIDYGSAFADSSSIKIGVPLLSGVDGCILPPEQLSVLAHRADLDAYPAGRDAPAVQFSTPASAALFISEPLRIVLLIQSLHRAHLDAAHAAGA